MSMLVEFVFAVWLTEALVELSVEAVVLERLRVWLGPEPHTLRGIFVRCGYCQSFWVGIGIAYLLNLVVVPIPVCPVWSHPLVSGLVVHRASNWWHDLIHRIRL